MKTKLFIIGALAFNSMLIAQTVEQRTEIKKSINAVELKKLEAKHQAAFELNEKKIAEFLLKNPQAKRKFSKKGSTYFIQSIDAAGKPVYINTKSNVESGTLIKANELYSGGSLGVNISGQNMVAGVWDGGQVRATHELLTGQVTMQAGQTVQSTGGDDHMCHVSGTMVGKAGITGNGASARGIAYNATAKCYDWANDLTEMTSFAGDGFLISNHSYGLANDNTTPVWEFGAYNQRAADWDELLKTTPNYLVFAAGGNEQTTSGNPTKLGYDLISSFSAAKNVVTVGAIDADKSMNDYSNWGPTDDGRLKPDLVARGTRINSAQSTSNNAYSGTSDESSGTSYASPAAAAGALLLQQYYFSLNNSYMKASTLKALMLGTAEDLGQVGPDNKFGWGLLNLEKAAQTIKKRSTISGTAYSITTSKGSIIEEINDNPTNNSTAELSRTFYAKGGEPIVVNICWTDDESSNVQTSANGIDPTTNRLVYDFDVLVKNETLVSETHVWKTPSMANRADASVIATDWFQYNTGSNGNNFKQVITPTANADDSFVIDIRKKINSPVASRTISVVITGVKENVLANESFENSTTIAFYDRVSNSIKIISNDNLKFDNYKIYDITGKNIQEGNSVSNEIAMNKDFANGIYVIKFSGPNKISSMKFIK